jgi:hypothetical protein
MERLMMKITVMLVLLGSVLSLGPWRASPAAQRNQPIYPAYDGYVKNPDGSYTLSFAYFSHNAEPVTIPPGRENGFAPAPGDRLQTTTFLPGHWRFQCVMVMGPDFDGHLVWNLTYAGATTGTSQNMLISSYNLVEGAADLKRIDYTNVPRGVCLNRAPDVRVLGVRSAGRGQPPVLEVGVGEELDLFGSVHDEGLPRGAALDVMWAKLSGPGSARFSNAKAARTLAFFDAPGLYELELTASDSEFTSRTQLNVQVHAISR